jgi:ubiquinone/menaquinone biosynthesis C-methylase UbiE
LFPSRRKETEPAAAYDIWSLTYDQQPDNLMLALDEKLLSSMLDPRHIENLDLENQVVADIGCGTGRHWKKILDRRPARLLGFDVSAGMLEVLREKYPAAETWLISGEVLPIPDRSVDLALSTLTIAHIPRLPDALAEWSRVLRPGGDLLITDYHPAALARGGQRTFRADGKLMAVQNHVYPIRVVCEEAAKAGLCTVAVTEQKIDEGMRSYYEKANALSVYRRFFGVPIIYGIHLRKSDAVL